MTGFEAMQATPVYFWLICFLSVMAVSISKSGFGGALGSLSTPILLFVLPPKLALGVLLPLFLITDIWVVYINVYAEATDVNAWLWCNNHTDYAELIVICND